MQNTVALDCSIVQNDPMGLFPQASITKLILLPNETIVPAGGRIDFSLYGSGVYLGHINTDATVFVGKTSFKLRPSFRDNNSYVADPILGILPEKTKEVTKSFSIEIYTPFSQRNQTYELFKFLIGRYTTIDATDALQNQNENSFHSLIARGIIVDVDSAVVASNDGFPEEYMTYNIEFIEAQVADDV